MRITAARAVANFLELAGDVSEANILISSLAPRLEKIPEPSAEAIGGAVRAIHLLLEDVEEDASLLFEQARRSPKAEPSK